MLAATIVAAVLVYFIGLGATYAVLVEATRDEAAQFFGAAIWPLVAPALLGARAIRWLRAPKRAELPPASVVRK